MGLHQAYKINMGVCQNSVQHMWETRCDVNKALISEALGGFLSFLLHSRFEYNANVKEMFKVLLFVLLWFIPQLGELVLYDSLQEIYYCFLWTWF